MRKKNRMRMCLLLVLVGSGMVAPGSVLMAQNRTDAEWEEKVDALTQKLGRFVPQPVAGIVDDNWPGPDKGRGTWTYYACSETGGCGMDFAPIAAGRTWHFEDQALAKQLEAAAKELDAQSKGIMDGTAEAADLERARKSERIIESSEENQAAMAKYSAQIGELADKLSDPNLTVKQRDQLRVQMQELNKEMEKLGQKHQATMATLLKPAGEEEAEKLRKRLKDLVDGQRRLAFRLGGNETLVALNGVRKNVIPRSGTLKGRPFYRYTQTRTRNPLLPEHVYLAVLVGPENFKNALQGGTLRADLKTIWVSVSIESTPQSIIADEAIARQLLETVDYDGLARLLTP